MKPQNLEELLKAETFLFPDTSAAGELIPLQKSIDEAIVLLRAGGKKMVIVKIFSDNTLWIGQKVMVLDENDERKEVSVQLKSLTSVYQLQVEYFDPAEVKEF